MAKEIVATVHLAPQQAQVIQRWAEQERKSIPVLIQEIVAQQLARRFVEERQADVYPNPLLELVGVADTGLGDAAVNHDQYLYGVGAGS